MFILTHWGRDKMATIFQITYWNGFFLMKMYGLWLKFHGRFVPRSPINNIPALVQIMAWHRPDDKPLSEPMMVSLLTRIYVAWPQWVKHKYPFSWTKGWWLPSKCIPLVLYTKEVNWILSKLPLHSIGSWAEHCLTHWGLVTPYGDRHLGEHWLR